MWHPCRAEGIAAPALLPRYGGDQDAYRRANGSRCRGLRPRPPESQRLSPLAYSQSSMQIGDLVVDPIYDGVMRAPATVFYSGTDTDQWSPHKRFLEPDGAIRFDLRSEERRV